MTTGLLHQDKKEAASRQKRGGLCCPPRGFSMKIRVVSYGFSRFIFCRAAACVSGFSLAYTRLSVGPSISGHSRHDSPRQYVSYPLLSGKPNVSHRKVSLDSNGFLSKKRRLNPHVCGLSPPPIHFSAVYVAYKFLHLLVCLQPHGEHLVSHGSGEDVRHALRHHHLVCVFPPHIIVGVGVCVAVTP